MRARAALNRGAPPRFVALGAGDGRADRPRESRHGFRYRRRCACRPALAGRAQGRWLDPLLRSEEHTSELQSHSDLVCRLLLEKKKKKTILKLMSHTIVT